MKDIDGELWMFFRDLLNQGGSIHDDYRQGRFDSYEDFAQRLCAAARERIESEQWQKLRAAIERRLIEFIEEHDGVSGVVPLVPKAKRNRS